MAHIKEIRFAHVGRNEGCLCDKCGQYEVYGLTRTGCCGCPISYKAIDDLERIRPYEPTLVKAAWNIFGDSYRYRQQYNEYKRHRMESEKNPGQCSMFE